MMEVSVVDGRQKLLIATYLEYLRDIPDFGRLTHKTLNMEKEVFAAALEKLEIEGLAENRDGHPVISREGIYLVETTFDIEPLISGFRKYLVMKNLCENHPDWAPMCEFISDFEQYLKYTVME